MSNKALFVPELSDSEDLFSSESESSDGKEDDYDIEVDWYGLRPKGSKWLWIGIYFILEGHIQVVNRSDKYVLATIFKGEYFGESSILRTVGYEYYGDLLIGDKGLKLMFIPRNVFMELPIHERLKLKDIAASRFIDLNRMVEWKYAESSIF